MLQKSVCLAKLLIIKNSVDINRHLEDCVVGALMDAQKGLLKYVCVTYQTFIEGSYSMSLTNPNRNFIGSLNFHVKPQRSETDQIKYYSTSIALWGMYTFNV